MFFFCDHAEQRLPLYPRNNRLAERRGSVVKTKRGYLGSGLSLTALHAHHQIACRIARLEKSPPEEDYYDESQTSERAVLRLMLAFTLA